MSVAELLDLEKFYKKSCMHDSCYELEARYLSGGTSNTTLAHKLIREDRQQAARIAQMSLDIPMIKNSVPSQDLAKGKQTKEKRYKHPTSPGKRIAQFLNSLFNHKKKKTKSGMRSAKDDEESPDGVVKRRSSISHFYGTDSKSLYSSSTSGFRTPPPYANTPTKVYKDITSSFDRKLKSSAMQYELSNGDRNTKHGHGLHDKFKFSNGKSEKDYDNGFSHGKVAKCVDHEYMPKTKEFRKISDVDDDADSDSSSDLFDLPNYELNFYSSGLPVYETTDMDCIKRGVPTLSCTSTV